MTQSEVHLKFDGQQLLDALSDLNLYVDSLPSDLKERLGQFLFVGYNLALDFVNFETLPTPDLWIQTIFLKPSDRLLDLLSAYRAGNLDNFLLRSSDIVTAGIDVQRDGVYANTSVYRKETI